ncbi:hypothetical protein EDD36DRAFT_444442 [Exophiala viscosa]|uniref:Phytanoyl-CoA dioxygenase n=1 Tax=Exophiala viscosa TaxID=2486360 RepID=A0AAN6DSM8_9EURO|nr:hypothetical protein EDD36DRAFT_444442 [Exophiala viscosa]
MGSIGVEDPTYPPVSGKRTAPEVPAFHNDSVKLEEVIDALRVAGGCVIRGAVPVKDVNQIEKDVRPWLDADVPWEEGGFFPRETRRAHGLAQKSPTYMKSFVMHPIYQQACDRILSRTSYPWVGQKREETVSKPQLNTTVIFSIGPGAKPQDLHRDDMIHHNYVSEDITPDQWTFSREAGIGWFVAGKKTTRANGATRYIPGSHLWDSEIPPDESLAFYAELEPGDCFMMLSSCYHAGSANTTKDEERLVYCSFMTRGYLRQVSKLRPVIVGLRLMILLLMNRKKINTSPMTGRCSKSCITTTWKS